MEWMYGLFVNLMTQLDLRMNEESKFLCEKKGKEEKNRALMPHRGRISS